ncbi:nucleotide disphospho-sugar-binding domain-containing protein [Spirilliplanes yamanashiensis]|uniref:Glucosyl transferase n=1 Tax=Spirilliplanes yamanashiensis TaxID=42233 RepID=A0A8J4DGJ9_9ACTN|nr:nucleotide disphospho-sugar-binding domain-containing protein [Spirilliplanes yamanashiensis]MDP9814105.1 hypothetical protein [Spirilliplanes yamanashiensis]GIJ00914.1 glucosyl transferase [Spirilliplanes yamanashiensis]
MRVLVVAAPLVGHLLPLVPLARALKEAGHEVLLASGGDAIGVATPGLPKRDVAPGVSVGRAALPLVVRHPRLMRLELQGRAGVRAVAPLFARIARKMGPLTDALVEQWQPDLVLVEPLAVAGALAARRTGTRTVVVENSLFDGRVLAEAVAAEVGKPFVVGELVTIAPPSVVGARAGTPVRAVPFSGGGDVPEWLARRGDRPRVVVSYSTVRSPGGGGDPTAAVVAAAPGVDAEFVLVRGPRKGLPANVRTVGRVPLHLVLPHADAFVHHGGAGSVLGALAEGVPQLVVPGAGDRRFNAEAVQRRGAGMAVDAAAISAADLERLLTDEGVRAAAREVRDEMAAMPAPAELAQRL